ncbi:MAG: CPBP family glutamic-type intramembrane protease [Pirellulales bacterium]
MNWTNVILILHREVRDQLRDRRMLFMMFVLPLLLYPLMGLSFTQLAQFLQEHPAQILLVDAPTLDGYRPLLETKTDDEGKQATSFAEEWKRPGTVAELLPIEVIDRAAFEKRTNDDAKVETPTDVASTDAAVRDTARAKRLIDREQAEVVVVFPPDFAAKMAEFQRWIMAKQTGEAVGDAPKPGHPRIYANSAKDKSMLAKRRVENVLVQWQDAIGARHLQDAHVPLDALKPFDFDEVELAAPQQKNAAAWSKILPMMLIIWALTGAFYPAIDLCAGEKERGTLETLLTSPAEREEIVAGKMLTVTMFSLMTSLLNLVSIGATGMFVMSKLQGMSKFPTLGLPPIESLAMLAVALIPVSILFSARLHRAGVLRKEQQRGAVLLDALDDGRAAADVDAAGPADGIVAGERVDSGQRADAGAARLLGRRVSEGLTVSRARRVGDRRLLLAGGPLGGGSIQPRRDLVPRERTIRPETLAASPVRRETRNAERGDGRRVALVMFIGKFYLEFAIAGKLDPQAESPVGFLAKMVLVTQIAVMLAPALIMAFTLTTKPAKTLLLRPVRLTTSLLTIPLAVLLAVLFHPAIRLLGEMLQRLYPIGQDTLRQIQGLESQIKEVPLAWAILLVALVPAVCEELAFRGFILSGLRHWGGRMRAILATAVLFGLIHGILQQSIAAAMGGIVMGYIAVKTESLWPCIAYHFTNNSLALTSSKYISGGFGEHPWLEWMFQLNADGKIERFQPSLVIIGLLSGGVVLAWFGRLPSTDTTEEELWDKINQNRSLEMT